LTPPVGKKKRRGRGRSVRFTSHAAAVPRKGKRKNWKKMLDPHGASGEKKKKKVDMKRVKLHSSGRKPKTLSAEIGRGGRKKKKKKRGGGTSRTSDRAPLSASSGPRREKEKKNAKDVSPSTLPPNQKKRSSSRGSFFVAPGGGRGTKRIVLPDALASGEKNCEQSSVSATMEGKKKGASKKL